MKKFLPAVLIIILALSFVLTGCDKSASNGANSTASAQANATADLSLQKVMDKKEFILGLDDSFPPMGFRNEDNQIVGFDIDVAREVCERLDVTLKLQPISWDAKEQELDTGNIDCIWNGMSIDAERAKAMNLSEAYMKNRMVLVVLNSSGINTLADLADKKVAVQNGSTALGILDASTLKPTLSEVITFEDNMTAFMDLDTQGVDAVFLDEVVANYYITTNQKDYKVLDEGLYEEEYAVGFRKGDQALRDKVQDILHEMKQDGTLAQISTTWFGKDVTVVK